MTALVTYSRRLEIFGRAWTYDVRPVTLNHVPMHGVYCDGILRAAFMVDEHACRYVDQMVGAWCVMGWAKWAGAKRPTLDEEIELLSAEEFCCYPCSRGNHADCKGTAWVPDIPCRCPHE